MFKKYQFIQLVN